MSSRPRIRRIPAALHKRPGRRARMPWEQPASLAAELPCERDAWLACVADAFASAPTRAAAEESLGLNRNVTASWVATLRAEHAAGRLPEALPLLVAYDAFRAGATPPEPPPPTRRGRPRKAPPEPTSDAP